MNRKIIIIAAVFVAALVSGISISIVLDSSGDGSKEKPVHHVLLLRDGADPDAVFIRLGERVQFDSRDGQQHIIAQGGGDEFDQNHSHEEFGVESGTFGPSEAYLAGFKRTGTYHFHDHLNPKIFVTVVVYNETNGTNKP